MHLASVTTVFPEATNPWSGLSVQERVNALSRRVREHHPDLRLALIGEHTRHEPDYPRRIEREVARMKLSDYVYLPGSLPPEKVVVWLQAAELFVSASANEGCSCALLEALACGVPAAATAVGDNERLLGPPHRGVLAKAREAPALATAIRKALKDRWNRTRIAEFEHDYSWDDVARRTLEFYRERLNLLSDQQAQR